MTFPVRSLLLCVLALAACGEALRAQAYYTVDQIDQAKAEARSNHLPIAWLSSHLRYLNANYANQAAGSDPELTVLALNALQGQAVVIFQDGDDDLPRMPQNMVDRIETKDEGELPGGWHYTAPKIIYVDPDLKTVLGCTLAPDVRSDRESAIATALLRIKHDPQAQALIMSSAKPDAASTSPTAPPQPATAQNAAGIPAASSGFSPAMLGAAAAFLLVLAGMGFLALRNRS